MTDLMHWYVITDMVRISSLCTIRIILSLLNIPSIFSIEAAFVGNLKPCQTKTIFQANFHMALKIFLTKLRLKTYFSRADCKFKCVDLAKKNAKKIQNFTYLSFFSFRVFSSLMLSKEEICSMVSIYFTHSCSNVEILIKTP